MIIAFKILMLMEAPQTDVTAFRIFWITAKKDKKIATKASFGKSKVSSADEGVQLRRKIIEQLDKPDRDFK